MTTRGDQQNPLARLHEAFNERDADTMRSLLAEDVVWHIPGDHPMAGTYRGRDEVWERFVAPMFSSAARIEDHAVLTHPDHGHVAVLMDVVHDFGDGERHLRGIEVAHTSDGRIIERWAFDENQEEVDRLITAAAEGLAD